ncbi:Leucine-rich repeat-containing protein 4B [Frankliniella fusca]|uniref:Leucine-rich repeat-containing protein 4B n=1 Tax=Frankliniella fusca TaxID=407009 RepID=A0AAE1H0V2_9NEOP|nr:Leucine-rich repeat-containing protein 4B [Frankliniella fusca]
MAASSLLACLSCLVLVASVALADARAGSAGTSAPAAADALPPTEDASRVRRAPAPESESLVLGMPRGGINCKYAPVYGYLSADCSDRGLEGIPPLRTGVEALDMSENKMKAVLNNTFAHLANLRYLYLNENRIKAVEAGALVMLRYLEVIDLSGNRLQAIPTGLLDLPRLRKLYFADNLLGRLDPSFVFASPTLQLLQLAECSLPELPLGAMPELLHLNVSRNALSTLPLHDLSAMCRLQILDLSHMAETLFEELDMEEACQCQTFVRWAKLRELDLGRSTRIVCKNDTNSADAPYMPTCNATQVQKVALEMHGRCVQAEQLEMRAQMQSWWVIAFCVVLSTVLAVAIVLCYFGRRNGEPRHHKVPVVVVTEPGHANGGVPGRQQGGRQQPQGRGGGGTSSPDGK